MTKISDLTALTGAGVDDAADLLTIVDMSEAGAARNKKITIDETRIALGLSSADSPQFTALNLGHASDTTISRVSAGVAAIEGVNIVTTAGAVTFAADISVPDEAYDATAWNGSLEVPTKNAVRDKIETLVGGTPTELDDLTDVNAPTPSNGDVLTWDSTPGEWVSSAPAGGGSGVDVEDEGVSEAAGATTLNFTGAGVTATDMGGGVVDVDIPGGGGGGSPFEVSPTVPVASGFTLQNAGTASMADSTFGIVITAPSATDNIRFVRLNGAPPATPFAMTGRFAQISGRHGAAFKYALIARNNTSGRIIIFGEWDGINYLIQRHTSYTSGGSNAAGPQPAYPFSRDIWLQMEFDGTNIICKHSPDGETFFTVHTEPLAAHINAAGGTVDEIGWGVRQASSGFEVKSICQSFEAA